MQSQTRLPSGPRWVCKTGETGESACIANITTNETAVRCVTILNVKRCETKSILEKTLLQAGIMRATLLTAVRVRAKLAKRRGRQQLSWKWRFFVTSSRTRERNAHLGPSTARWDSQRAGKAMGEAGRRGVWALGLPGGGLANAHLRCDLYGRGRERFAVRGMGGSTFPERVARVTQKSATQCSSDPLVAADRRGKKTFSPVALSCMQLVPLHRAETAPSGRSHLSLDARRPSMGCTPCARGASSRAARGTHRATARGISARNRDVGCQNGTRRRSVRRGDRCAFRAQPSRYGGLASQAQHNQTVVRAVSSRRGAIRRHLGVEEHRGADPTCLEKTR